MKRLLLSLAILLAATSSFAFDAVRRGDRIGVLRMSVDRDPHGEQAMVIAAVESNLRRELQKVGFEAFDARQTYDQLVREDNPTADYYVEVVSGHTSGQPIGGVGVGGSNIDVGIGVLISHLAAQLRLYDGRTFELIDTFDLSQRRTAIMPTSVGVGSRHLYAWIALPFVQYAQYRSAARGVARDAARIIAGETRGR